MSATVNASLSPTLSPPSPKVRRQTSSRRRAISQLPPVQTVEAHEAALKSIRAHLRSRTNYDSFPVSYRIIVLDTKLEVRKALQCLLYNGVVSAPLWNSEKSKFAGMLTVSDIIHLIQYYYHTATYETAAADVETLRLEDLRQIETALGVDPVPLVREHPSSSLFAAAKRLIETHARRLPLLDMDTETGHEVIVSVLTQYRLLKFIAINCAKEVAHLHLPLRKLKIGTYVAASPNSSMPSTEEGDEQKIKENPFYPIATATLKTRVFDVVHMFSERGISAVPIIDENGVVVNLYETVDVITLVRLGAYQSLDLTIEEALNQRSPDFPGVVICNASDSLGTLLQLIKKRRVHRLVVVEGDAEERQGGKKGRLLGIITHSDVLKYIVGEVGIGETNEEGEAEES
ncbi:CBS-domain-containing [Pyrrhoderma noxium]|uniref:CBS-domain-containing n=1 Tax=Pyrrhoderma noxium TaxID=2282107 RepID=A0A286URV6_9AGAM|nr:CBS-domain-containing [Pyrrhoderma noxium]